MLLFLSMLDPFGVLVAFPSGLIFGVPSKGERPPSLKKQPPSWNPRFVQLQLGVGLPPKPDFSCSQKELLNVGPLETHVLLRGFGF